MVWADQEVWSFRHGIEFMDFKELLSWIIVEGKLLELFAFTAWTIWNQQNHVKLQLQAKLLHQVAEQSKAVMNEYHTNL